MFGKENMLNVTFVKAETSGAVFEVSLNSHKWESASSGAAASKTLYC